MAKSRSSVPHAWCRDSRTGSAGFYWGSPPGAWPAIGVQPRRGGAGGGGGRQPGSICIPEYRYIPEQGGTVPKEMVSSPLNPLLRFRK